MATKSPFVFDEKFFLESLQEGWAEIEDLFSSDCCFSLDEAIRLFNKNQYELTISVIRMNNQDGSEDFKHLEKNN